MGFSRQEYWSGLRCPSSEDLPNPEIKPSSLTSPALAGGVFTTSTTWEALSGVSSVVQLCPTLCDPWTATCQPSLSITNSRSLLKLISIESVMPSNHLILCRPLLLPSVCPSIRVFSNESALCIRWPKYWSFSFSINPSSESVQFSSIPQLCPTLWGPMDCSTLDFPVHHQHIQGWFPLGLTGLISLHSQEWKPDIFRLFFSTSWVTHHLVLVHPAFERWVSPK